MKIEKSIPFNWKWVTLEDIGIVTSGGTPSTKEPEFWGDEIPWITPSDLSKHNDTYISKGKRNISKIGLEYSSAKLIPKNSILFSSRAPIGYVAIAKNDLATNQGFKNLIISDSINPKYVYYYLSTVKEIAEKMASGTTFLEISATKFKQIPFPLAPTQEQTRIVEKIETVFQEIKSLESVVKKSLNDLNVYLDKVTLNAFSKESNPCQKTTTLNKIGKIVSGGTPKTKVKEFWGDDIKWITPSDLSDHTEKFISEGKRSLSNEGLKKSSAKLLPKNTVLFSSRAPIGYVVIANNDLATNQGFKSIIPNDNINSSYLYYYLKSIKEYANEVASGTTFLELSLTKFKEIPFPLVSIERQIEIVEEIEYAESHESTLKKILNDCLDKCNFIRSKILKNAYEGKITNQSERDTSIQELIELIKIEKETI